MKVDNQVLQLTKEIQERLNILSIKYGCEATMSIQLKTGEVFKYEKPILDNPTVKFFDFFLKLEFYFEPKFFSSKFEFGKCNSSSVQ
jgi:hypothetical protein